MGICSTYLCQPPGTKKNTNHRNICFDPQLLLQYLSQLLHKSTLKLIYYNRQHIFRLQVKKKFLLMALLNTAINLKIVLY